MLASNVAVDLNVLGAFMKDIIMSNVDSTTIITIKRSGNGLWMCVKHPLEAIFLGFGRWGPWTMCVWLVSSVEDSICTDLKEEALIAKLVDLRHGCEQRWLHDFVESKSGRQHGKWLGWRTDLCARGKFLSCVEIFV